jgi:hypothetical protein
MPLRVIGAGLGRTGTTSLKVALSRLLGGPCYHMYEVIQHPEHVSFWHAAVRGDTRDWDALLHGYAAAVDWPASAFWRELAEAYPDALILLSTRSAESWWASASETIFAMRGRVEDARAAMIRDLLSRRFTDRLDDREAAMAAFEAHNADVRASAPRDRLVEWTTADGWGPLCDALGVPVPDEPFPRVNTRDEFKARIAELAKGGS